MYSIKSCLAALSVVLGLPLIALAQEPQRPLVLVPMPEQVPLVSRLGGTLFDVQPLMPRGAASDYAIVDCHVRGLRRASIYFSDPGEQTTAEALWCDRLAAQGAGFRVVSLLHHRSHDGAFLAPFNRGGELPHTRTVRAIAEELCRLLPDHRESIQGKAATLVAEIEARTMLRALAEGLVAEGNRAEHRQQLVHRQVWRFSSLRWATLLKTLEGVR